MPSESFISWSPPWSLGILLGIFAILAAIAILIRVFAQKPLVKNNLVFLILRAAMIVALGIILFGPTLVERRLGLLQRSDLFYLIDGSTSMDLDEQGTRWNKTIQFLKEADRIAGDDANGNVHAFQFGHRISPLLFRGTDAVTSTKATDTRLADALRQISSRFGSSPPVGVVVLSDGRVRDAEATEQIARRLGENGVPIHVVAVGEPGSGGDVAVISAVVPPRVRKYSDFEIQIFIRSFGMSGRRTVVRVIDVDLTIDNALGGKDQVGTVASVPLILSGGAQAISLPIRLDDRGKTIRVVVDPLDGEISQSNNQVEARIEINRTQIRAMYIEGANQSRVMDTASALQELLSNPSGSAPIGRQNAASRVEKSLNEDEDIDCIAFRSTGQPGQLQSVAQGFTRNNLGTFPTSRSQLYALDCVILSNVGPSALNDEQASRLVEWIAVSGGGLLVVGNNALRPDDWKDSPLRAVLPVLLPETQSTSSRVRMQSAIEGHSIMKLTRDHSTNVSILEQMPPFETAITGIQAAPLAETIAVLQDEKRSPCIIGGRYGRGRVLVATVPLTGGDAETLYDNWGEVNGRNIGKLWRNLVYWDTESSSIGRRRLVATADKRFYRPGDTVRLSATAFNETAHPTSDYRVWCMLEPSNPNDSSLYSQMLWPDGQIRTSGETGPRIAWGEEFLLHHSTDGKGYELPLALSENDGGGDSSMRAELTAFDGQEKDSGLDHGTQIDSVSLEIQILSDPFEMRNPLPNPDLLARLASISGGKVLRQPGDLAELLKSRASSRLAPTERNHPAWNNWWLLGGMLCLMSLDWIGRRALGMA